VSDAKSRRHRERGPGAVQWIDEHSSELRSARSQRRSSRERQRAFAGWGS